MNTSRSETETRRQDRLAEFRILDTGPEAIFDDLVELVARSCQVPMVILSLMDDDRQWFKASVGLEFDETQRHVAFCNRVIETGKPVTIEDAAAEAGYRNNPLVTGSPHLRFYCGVPLRTRDGFCIGSLAVLDTRPRNFTPDQVASLKAFARVAMHSMELRRTRLALEDSLDEQGTLQRKVIEGNRALEQAHELLNFHLDNMPLALVQFDENLRVARWSSQSERMFGWSEEEVLGQPLDGLKLIHPGDQERVTAKVSELIEGQTDASMTVVNRNQTRSGETLVCEWHNSARFDRDGRLLSVLSFATDITERKRTEKALRLSEQRYRHAAEASQAALWDFDMLTGKVTFSEVFRDMLGYERIEDMPDTLEAYMQLMHPDDRERVYREAERLVAGETGDRASAEFRLLTQSGAYRWVQSNSKVIRDAEGKAVRRLGSTVDIHERKIAEEQLKEQAERMRGILEVAGDAIVTIDESAIIETANPATERIFGYSAREMLGRNVRMLMTESDAARHDNVLARYLETGQARIMGSPQKLEARRKDGSVFPIELMVTEVQLSDRRIFTGFIRDITHQERSRQALAEQAELLDKARDAIIVTDLDGIVTFWNQGAERIYGWESAEMQGVAIFERTQSSRESWTEIKQQVLDAGGWEGQVRHLRKDGRERTLQCRLTLVRDEHGQPRSILAINTDVTDKLALEEQLRQAQKLESIGQLTGGVAHDFNNLLTVILGNAELLNESLDDNPALKGLVEMTLSAAQRGAELTNQLLAFARRQTLEPRPVDLFELVTGLKPLLRRSLPEDIKIEINRDSSLWRAEIDPVQLESAVLNLALNARDAMEGGGRLSIHLSNSVLDRHYADNHPEVEPGQYIELAVTDTGAGIRPEVMRHLFEPFFTTKEKGKGTGLGLPIIYGFIKQSRGHIRVYSEEGVGTTVRMYLPKAAGDAKAGPGVIESESVTGGTERVLLVEDDPLVLDHAGRLLRQLGYQVTTASDGEQALELATAQPIFDLLLTDVIMPGRLKGPGLADEIRRIIPDIRVLFTSGYTQDVITPEVQNSDSFHLLEKPYRKADLARKLRQVLDG